MGGTVAPGVVIGGGVYTVAVPSAKGEKYKFSGESDPNTKSEWDMLTLGVVGPFMDYYFDPQGGMHLQAALGIASLQVSDGTFETSGGTIDSDKESGIGFGAMLGFGLETWVGEQWSVGGLLRVLYTSTTIEADLPGTYIEADWETKALVPALLFTATYH